MTLDEAIQQLFPGAVALRDYVLIDAGRGAYIAQWNLSEPRPSAEQLAVFGVTEGKSMSREDDFISEARTANRKIWDGLNALKSLQREWQALDYGTNLDDGAGANTGITRVMVGAVVFDTANAIETLLGQGHATNMAKLL